MQTIRYKLIVSDFDGTLVRGDGTVSEKDRQAIADYVEAGGIFAICTGRLPSGILHRARELGLRGLLCCCQGNIVLDIESGRVLFEEKLPVDVTVSICRAMEAMHLHIHAYDLWDYYANMEDEPLRLYERVTDTKARVIAHQNLSDYLEENGLGAYKLLAMVAPQDNARVCEALRRQKFPGCEVTKSMELLVEVINAKYSKATAISRLATHYGILEGETVAVGDHHNDIPMIEYAAVGVSVANGAPALKARADYVCQNTNETSAIAEVIARFGFGTMA